MRNFVVVGWLVLSLFLFACNERVMPGHVGMVQTSGGMKGGLLQPGHHSCFGRDFMTQIQTSEMTIKEKNMNIRCKDKLNTETFHLVIRARPLVNSAKTYKRVLKDLGAVADNGLEIKVTSKIMYELYVSETARNIARTVVAEYNSDDIVANRIAIQKAINKQLKKALEGTPMQLISALVNSVDPHKSITKAIASAKERELAIKEEEANQAIELLKTKNRQEIAEQEKLTRAKEAQAEAAYMAIIGKALTPAYLERLEIQTEQKRINAENNLYSKVGKGDKVIMTGNGNAMPIVGK